MDIGHALLPNVQRIAPRLLQLLQPNFLNLKPLTPNPKPYLLNTWTFRDYGLPRPVVSTYLKIGNPGNDGGLGFRV